MLSECSFELQLLTINYVTKYSGFDVAGLLDPLLVITGKFR